jgi:hypothetical protein
MGKSVVFIEGYRTTNFLPKLVIEYATTIRHVRLAGSDSFPVAPSDNHNWRAIRNPLPGIGPTLWRRIGLEVGGQES